eukprot:NODE_40_length_35084_cov_0.543519.p27 type:complete len:108 gc:universal NODE_40_length_35084_cov_0.543519:34570-34247(-)
MNKFLTNTIFHALKKGPKSMQQLFEEAPEFSHRTIKTKLVRQLSHFKVVEVKKDHIDRGKFKVKLRETLPGNVEEILGKVEKYVTADKKSKKINYNVNRTVTFEETD